MKQTIVVKIGGRVVEPGGAPALARDIGSLVACGLRVVVVHGGGTQISAALAGTGREPRFIDGLRVTSPDDIALLREAMLSINAELVQRLTAANVRAVGLAGDEDNLLQAEVERHDLGLVGRITSVDGSALCVLLDNGVTPVVAAMGAGPNGTLNVNADTAAAAVATALQAEKLIVLSDVSGIYEEIGQPDTRMARPESGQLQSLLEKGALSGGMVPKVTALLAAINGGVGSVSIVDGRSPGAALRAAFGLAEGTEVVA
ncbi:MAG: acetylglutamate kinase [Dehalococcoidia bacterium]